MHWLLDIFLYPGNLACDLLHADHADDRMMIRTLVNMLVWNAVVIVGAVLLWQWGMV
ncbi:MAG TPA: hypothetical protein VFW75_10875 [Acetobacteraceae bacterium]|nr:hypothetical protein [Acetobacteraceae bacterium]